MFIDETVLTLSSGSGGDGHVSFSSVKFIEHAGPDGGDGGKGGDLYIESSYNLNTLLHFRNIDILKAKDGEHGKNKNMYGSDGEDLVVKLPVGTLLRDYDTGKLLFDFDKPIKLLLLKGGIGGKGNVKFKSASRQAPYIALKGKAGIAIRVKLELKLLADVALVGLPNAGKSSFINSVSAAKSKVANYPFTTLEPKLGIVKFSDKTFVVADIPGLIEGAAEGKGLGHKFLKHIERARIILHLVDLTQDNLINNFNTINSELAKYSDFLKNKKQIVVGTKIDYELSPEVTEFEKTIKDRGTPYFRISSATKSGLDQLIKHIMRELDNKEEETYVEETVSLEDIIGPRDEPDIVIERVGDVFHVKGRIVNSVMSKYILTSDAFDILLDILRKEKLDKKLVKAGVKTGDSVSVLGEVFEFVE